MMTHGYPKLLNLFSDNPSFGNPIGIGEVPTLIIAVLAEFIAPIFIIIGYRTKIFTLLPMVTMVIAAFVVHLDDPFKRKELSSAIAEDKNYVKIIIKIVHPEVRLWMNKFFNKNKNK